jgi:hypothetical protein
VNCQLWAGVIRIVCGEFRSQAAVVIRGLDDRSGWGCGGGARSGRCTLYVGGELLIVARGHRCCLGHRSWILGQGSG